MNAAVETITPELAQIYLARNTKNYRRINQRTVEEYAKDMAAGRWAENGECIKFHADGRLLDGQHRLRAIIKAGCPIKMLVVHGITADDSVIDVGRGRTARQIIEANGFSAAFRDTTTISAIAIFLTNIFSRTAATKAEILDYVANSDKSTWEMSHHLVVGATQHPPSKKGPVLLACYLLLKSGESEDELNTFFRVVNTGFPDDYFRDCSPALALRNQLIFSASGLTQTETRLLWYSSTISAFRDFKRGVSRRNKYQFNQDTLKLLERIRSDELRE